MKFLTKDWVKRYEQVRVINWLKDIVKEDYSLRDVKKKSKKDFFDNFVLDTDRVKIALTYNCAYKFYNSQHKTDKTALRSLPKAVYHKIKDKQAAFLGYAIKDDKELLEHYAKELLISLEKESETSHKTPNKLKAC